VPDPRAGTQLETICAVVDALLAVPARERSARELVMNLGTPLAIFEGIEHRPRLLNTEWKKRFGPGRPLALEAELDAVVMSGEPLHFEDTVLDSSERLYTGVVHPLRTARGAIRGVVIACADVTDDGAATRDRFLAVVSHELRGPLTTILIWERVMRAQLFDPELRVRALDAIRDSANRQARLVADLFDISRAISGKLHVELRPIEIAAVLAISIESAEPAAIEKHQAIERRIDAELGLVAGDANRLHQILGNLLSNAIRCTPEHGQITVAARRSPDSVVIEVSDTGCGIAAEDLAKIFDPFSQAEHTIAAHGGLGLGLAIAHELVAAHKATLVASSPGPGAGAAFTLTMPISAQQQIQVTEAAAVERLSGMRLLLVDDDPRVLEALRELLEQAGAVVDTADSVANGFGALARTMPDLILSDIAMPGEDGLSFMRRIRETMNVPAVAITAHASQADRARALAAGFDLYVTKPLRLDHLISSIARLVVSSRAAK